MTNTALDLKLELDGYSKVVNAIRQTEPDIRKEMDKSIRTALKAVGSGAKSRYGKGDWVVRINKKALFGRIEATPSGVPWGKQSLDELSPGVRAAVLEFIGTKYSGDRPQVKGLIDSMNRRYGQPGRFLWAAWDERGQAALNQIGAAVLRAEQRLKAAMLDSGEVL